jgi:hypothetical protein
MILGSLSFPMNPMMKKVGLIGQKFSSTVYLDRFAKCATRSDMFP